MEIYFDNSATTKVCPQAIEKAVYIMENAYGNPSSLHNLGFSAEKEMNTARDIISEKIGCLSKELYFTSGGTESNNIAVLGGASSKKRFGNKIVTTAMEHPSVLESMKQLEKDGFSVEYLMPNGRGQIDIQDLENAIDGKTVLVSIMSVNNEVGSILPINAVSGIIKRKKSPALFHVDNVQGFGKININPQKLGIDLMSISGHKVHAPKGVGALYVSSKVRLMPRTFGGGQEKNLRPGTENVPSICAFGQAVRVMPGEQEEFNKILDIRNKLTGLLSQIEGIEINSDEKALPYILNFSCGKIRAETMLHFLEERGMYVSTGSACSKAKPSHVLTAMGLSKERIESSVRVSFSRFNTMEEVEPFSMAVKEGISTLAHR